MTLGRAAGRLVARKEWRMLATRETVAQADRARETIRRLFDQRRMSANVATSRLLAVDLAVQQRTARRRRSGRAFTLRP
jgi:hypothetical protein